MGFSQKQFDEFIQALNRIALTMEHNLKTNKETLRYIRKMNDRNERAAKVEAEPIEKKPK